jgi:hypothetical protein
MTLKIKAKPSKPKKQARVSTGYQRFQEDQALAHMRTHLSSDGLFAGTSESLGTAIGWSQPTANRVIRRIVDAVKRAYQIGQATVKQAGVRRPIANRLGQQATCQIFPWTAPYSSVNTERTRIKTGDAAVTPSENTSPYSSVNASTYSYEDRQLSAGTDVSVSMRTVVPYSQMNTVPPMWAVERQLAPAKERLKELQTRLRRLLRQDKSVSHVDAQIEKERAYIADLEAWQEWHQKNEAQR